LILRPQSEHGAGQGDEDQQRPPSCPDNDSAALVATPTIARKSIIAVSPTPQPPTDIDNGDTSATDCMRTRL